MTIFPTPALFRRRPPTAPTPAPWRGFPAAFFCRAGAHASPRSRSTALAIALCLPRPCHARCRVQKHPRRPPPRRRRGELAAEPQDPFFRAPEHYKKPRTLFLSSFRQFPNPTPQNAAAAPQNAGELTLAVEPRLRSSSARADRLASSAVTSRSS